MSFTFSDLSASFVRFLNTEQGNKNSSSDELFSMIHPGKHLLFVFVDGLGTSFLDRLPERSFLRRNKVRDLTSVFPSTTPCAMMTLATGLEPLVHGIPGRWSFLKEQETQINTLGFFERFQGRPASEYGISTEKIWKYSSLYSHFYGKQRMVSFILPIYFKNSPFELFLCGQNTILRYSSLEHSIEQTIDLYKNGSQGRFTFLYLLDLDDTSHKYGTETQEVNNVLKNLDTLLEKLALSLDSLGSDTRICISADHGQITIPEENRLAIYEGDPLQDLLITPPFGEPRVPHFAVKQGMEEDFSAIFRKTFGDYFELYTAPEAWGKPLFGSAPVSESAKLLHGNFIAAAKGKYTLKYYPEGCTKEDDNTGEHGGNEEEERKIPLILA